MAWTAAFIQELRASTRRIAYRVETLTPLVGSTPGTAATFTEEEVSGYRELGASVQPGEWRGVIGGCSFILTRDDNATILAAMKPGVRVQVSATVNGVGPEIIRLGQVDRVLGGMRVGSVTVECLDLVSAMGTRPSASNPENLPLFSEIEDTLAVTQVTAGFAHGVDTTLNVLDTSGFSKSSAHDGLLRITPNGGASSGPYWYKWSASTALTFTISSDQAFDTIPDASAALPVGSNVKSIALVVAHPLDLIRQLLVSTGAGTNGAHDVLPALWGYGLDNSLIDHTDIGNQKSYASIGGTYAWDFYAEQEVTNAYQWVTESIAVGGFFVTIRQGLITARTAEWPHSGTLSGIVITDDDIHSFEIDYYDSDLQVQAGGVRVTALDKVDWNAGTGTPVYTTYSAQKANTGVSGFPAKRWFDYDYPLVRANGIKQDVIEEARDRLFGWATQRAERISMSCKGLRLAQLAVGDLVQVTSSKIQGRLESSGATYSTRKAFVASILPHWDEGMVELELLAPPVEANTTL